MRFGIPFFIALALAASVAGAKPARYLPCFWVTGRMTVGPGTPATRIWPRNSNRILGVVSRAHPQPDDAYAAELPIMAARLLTSENNFRAWGDFLVCPLSENRAGHMRYVWVQRARNLISE